MNRRRTPLPSVVVLFACTTMLLAVGQGMAAPKGPVLLPQFSDPVSVMVSGGLLRSAPHLTSGLVHIPSGFGGTIVPSGTCSAGRGGTCPHLQTQLTVSPSVICEVGAVCPAGVPNYATVSLWANATGNSQLVYPPNVQVIFDVETTLFDGVYDPTAGDAGRSSCSGPCKESNAVPFFVANAGTIAKDITGDFPGSNVSFAMVDYFSTSNCAPGSGGCNPPCTTGTTSTGTDDDGDGCQYHVDVSTFVDASKFGKVVPPYFANYTLGQGVSNGCTGGQPPVVYCDSDFSDNQLDSSSITSLYGALQGSGINLNPKADLVVVWMGSTAPRDGHYTEDYTPFDSDVTTGTTATCEPAFQYSATLSSPNCEGWVVPPTGNESIADLAISKHVLINTIDLDTGTTLLNGGDYLTPTAASATTDVNNIVQAGCDLATATGGSWAGPAGFTCNGQSGYLSGGFIPAGQELSPPTAWSSNPLLGTALTAVKFPLTWTNMTASGTQGNAFQYIPAAGFSIDSSNPNYQKVSCYRSPSQPPLPGNCNPSPSVTGLANNGVGWSWPDSRMYLNDSWGVSFNVQALPTLNASAVGVPTPVDACQAQLFASCVGPYNGSFSAAQYIPYTNAPPPVSASFPAGVVTVYDSGPVVKISAAPSSVDVRPVTSLPGVYATTLSSSTVGGSGQNGFAWSGLPPGCVPADLPSLYCSPTRVGTYNVTLAVTDSHGATGSAKYVLVVHPDPVAVLSASPLNGVAPLFTVGSAVVSGGLAPYVYDLSWGDRFNDSPTLPAHHAYLLPGMYRMGLTVTDAVGGEAVVGVSVTAVLPLHIALNVYPNSEPYVDRNLDFNATILGGSGLWPFAYSWSGLPDGCTGGNYEQVDCAPTSTYKLLEVTVNVADSAGENASASTNITVRSLPGLIDVPVVGPVPTGQLVPDLVNVLVGFLVGLVAYFVLIAAYRAKAERPSKDEESSSSPPSSGPPAAPAGSETPAIGPGAGPGDAAPPPGLGDAQMPAPVEGGSSPPPFVVPGAPPLPDGSLPESPPEPPMSGPSASGEGLGGPPTDLPTSDGGMPAPEPPPPR